ncbi:MAG: glycine cleavage system protein GcvH [Ktedonobacteraceae bacterium]|nr:glycine cleavage system protein GcvH [Ktedonobacteraceae bacterium]
MSNVPSDLRYTKDHEWVRVEGTQATIGITDHAQKQLGDVVFVELPKAGDTFSLSDPMGSLESVKAVAEFYAPLSGKVNEINDAVNDEPELVNTDPYGEGWLVKIQIADSSQLSQLLSADQYKEYIKQDES